MSSPVNERGQSSFPAFAPNYDGENAYQRSSDEDRTLRNDEAEEVDDPLLYHDIDMSDMDHNHLRTTTSYLNGPDHIGREARGLSPSMSVSQQRAASRRLQDDLEVLRAERVASNTTNEESLARSKSIHRSRSRTVAEPIDDFDVGTTPIHEKTRVYQPPANPTTKFSKLFKKIHNSSWLVRYFFYISPVTIILLIPMLLGLLVFKQSAIGGVKLFWFGIWLEIVWLTLWAGRIIAKCIPYPMGLVSSIFTNNSKKWRDLGKQLEVPATIFFWWLAVEISFLPTMKNHHIDGNKATKGWEKTVNKIIISIFVGSVLNFVEKIIIQLIAISFHLRTYADRIDINKFQISSLTKLYTYSKDKIAMDDEEFEVKNDTGPSSGTRTPMAYMSAAQKKTRHVFNKVGDVAGRVAGDFTGKQVKGSTHPSQVIIQLLGNTTGSQVLARRLYRTFVHEDSETIFSDDLRSAFDNDDEADAAFTMFDKDLNGDISMEELEAVCVEIGRERKAITASLKDLDSVVSKLDDVFLFAVFVVTIIVFVSLISTSASGVLTSLGSSLLALSWLFSATAQEFLQSCIFVFVKHPFDVGDRVTIYGNTGSALKGDDYFVKEIGLLYTEFKKMEGHVVQAPNSYLNTLFILNQRRSGGLAEAVPVTIKFGTTLEQLETLHKRLLEFVTSENREYQKNILTELTTIYEAHSITMNVVFFYKSNWQNEVLRMQRRNKFICALMVTMDEIGMEGPRMRLAGAQPNFPMHLQGAYPEPTATNENQNPGGPGPRSGSLARERDPAFVERQTSISGQPLNNHPSILRNRAGTSNSRHRGESISAMGKRVDFSLGMSAISSGADFGDVFDDPKPRLPTPKITTTTPSPGPSRTSRDTRISEDGSALTKTTSRDSEMSRAQSGTSGGRRNRFFNRGRSKLGTSEEGTSLDDLEAGHRNIRAADMPDIPEASGSKTVNWGLETEQLMHGDDSRGRNRGDTFESVGSTPIDPRTGIVSPQAIATDGALERGDVPISAPKRAMTEESSKHA
ncbi:putative MscS family protein [Lachnellula hyalina]|uniref:Putative MscS family protein n=1 Tax=Lachnellula hyalina TaxID=1316788 RepID=A0A8H8QVB5_9HELO|nr:putative MscS family protein [Lachnellula hyalina]TVY22365.1 putative MscS family protein [Lachnellula hyalina]